jgi:2-isopropylmalate synthase
MAEINSQELIYDWNLKGQRPVYGDRTVMLTDETLRDGDLGLCGAGPRFRDEVARMAKEIKDNNLGIQPQSAARTMIEDIEPIVEASQTAGIPIEACIFIGSSPIRQYVEGWDIETMIELSVNAVEYSIKNELPVLFVTEDTTRANPDALKLLYTAAIEAGAQRICLCDTVGHATPEGVYSLVSYIKREVVDKSGADVGIDWHGHRDRGLSIPNTLAAMSAGADRVHATALGVGERSGNTPMDLLLVNLQLLGLIDRDLTKITEYVELVAEKCNAPLPFNYPVVGADSFRTATGVHAAAVRKADAHGDTWLADTVYCGVPASMVGREQGIEIGPMSGEHNVRFWLLSRDIEDDDALVETIFDVAKAANTILSEEAIMDMVESHRSATGT